MTESAFFVTIIVTESGPILKSLHQGGLNYSVKEKKACFLDSGDVSRLCNKFYARNEHLQSLIILDTNLHDWTIPADCQDSLFFYQNKDRNWQAAIRIRLLPLLPLFQSYALAVAKPLSSHFAHFKKRSLWLSKKTVISSFADKQRETIRYACGKRSRNWTDWESRGIGRYF